MNYSVVVIQGFEWTFAMSPGEEGGYVYILDEWNATMEGEIEIVPDIAVAPDW